MKGNHVTQALNSHLLRTLESTNDCIKYFKTNNSEFYSYGAEHKECIHNIIIEKIFQTPIDANSVDSYLGDLKSKMEDLTLMLYIFDPNSLRLAVKECITGLDAIDESTLEDTVFIAMQVSQASKLVKMMVRLQSILENKQPDFFNYLELIFAEA